VCFSAKPGLVSPGDASSRSILGFELSTGYLGIAGECETQHVIPQQSLVDPVQQQVSGTAAQHGDSSMLSAQHAGDGASAFKPVLIDKQIVSRSRTVGVLHVIIFTMLDEVFGDL
jgi:hypothetical protein